MTVVEAGWLAERLAAPARALGVALPADAVEALARYAGLLLDWGARINLTGARTAEALADEHLADALALLPHLPAEPFLLLDVGSGGGLPGLALALLRPDARAVLLEPTAKKHAFLKHAIRSLGLGGRVEARRERLEAHLAGGGAGAYDVAVARAVWPAAAWLERGAAAVRPGGLVVGLEGASEGELLPGAERHPYRLGGRGLGERARAVVLRRV